MITTTDVELLIMLVLAIAGAIVSAIAGWADAGGDFDIRKFYPSVLRGVAAAISVLLLTVSGITGEITMFHYIGAFGIGMGLDAGWNRIAGAVDKAL